MKKSWLRIILEFFAIVFGILGAFALEEWNDDKEKEKLIREIMLTVLDDLEENLNDLKGDAQVHLAGLKSNAKLILFVDEEHPYSDELCYDFHFLQEEEYSIPLKNGYARLLNLNVESSVPDSIISNLSSVYEELYPRIFRNIFNPDISDYYSDYFIKHFRPNRDTTITYQLIMPDDTIKFPVPVPMGDKKIWRFTGYVPLDYNELVHDPKFAMMLGKSLEFRLFKYKRYRMLIDKVEKLMEDVEAVYVNVENMNSE